MPVRLDVVARPVRGAQRHDGAREIALHRALGYISKIGGTAGEARSFVHFAQVIR
jgi:hypothetical protein